jgi:hypothetical protein
MIRDDSERSASPTPDLNPTKIAQDFILQYYSVRSRYPDSLHRFYREDSILTMGCHHEEQVVNGKNEIADHFANVGYHNCANSVAAFNAQFVTPSCIAILISGEMSNNDENLRRYCEVFTLVRNGADRFYVKSHMFHFQDDAFHDNSSCSGTSGDQQPNTFAAVNDSPAAETCEPARNENSFAQHEAPSLIYGPSQVQMAAHPIDSNSCKKNVAVHRQQVHSNNHKKEQVDAETKAVQELHGEHSEVHQHGSAYSGNRYDNVDTTQDWNQHDIAERENDDTVHVSYQTNTVSKTWAGIAGSGSTVPVAHMPRQPNQGRRSGAPQSHVYENGRRNRPSALATPTEDETTESVPPNQEMNGRYGQNQPRDPHGANSQFRGNNVPRPRKPIGGVDEKQVFIGNLPRDCEESELTTFFEQFGTVQSVRIHQGRTGLLNYGFVVMESVESVDEILKKKPLLMRGTHRINPDKKHENVRRDYRKSNFSGGEYGPR